MYPSPLAVNLIMEENVLKLKQQYIKYIRRRLWLGVQKLHHSPSP